MTCVFYGDCLYNVADCQEDNPFFDCKHRKITWQKPEPQCPDCWECGSKIDDEYGCDCGVHEGVK